MSENITLSMLPMDTLNDAAACLKIMAHPIRLRIVDILMQGSFSVREISEMCGILQNQACEHLRLMQSCGFLASERKGRQVYYQILSPKLPALLNCLRLCCAADGSLPKSA